MYVFCATSFNLRDSTANMPAYGGAYIWFSLLMRDHCVYIITIRVNCTVYISFITTPAPVSAAVSLVIHDNLVQICAITTVFVCLVLNGVRTNCKNV